MIRFYKNMLAAYFLVSLIGGMALLSVFIVMKQNTFISFIIILIWIFCCRVFFEKVARGKYMKEVTSLFNNCHIRDYITANEKFLRKKIGHTNRNFLMLNLVAGYYQLGKSAQAKQLLSQINPESGTKKSRIWCSALYYIDLASICISLSDLEGAKQAIASMQSLLNNPATNKIEYTMILQQIEEKNMLLDISQNNYDGAIKYYTLRLSLETSLLGKVAASYHLANSCLHFNETEEAIEHLHFVIENGGDTFYVGKANEILHQITVNL